MKSCLREAIPYQAYIVNNMAVDDLATERPKASAAIILHPLPNIQFQHNGGGIWYCIYNSKRMYSCEVRLYKEIELVDIVVAFKEQTMSNLDSRCNVHRM